MRLHRILVAGLFASVAAPVSAQRAGGAADTRPEVAPSYLNVMFSYRPIRSLSLALFAGQRRGSLRCVGGVCRVYPPFEGMRLDATFRY